MVEVPRNGTRAPGRRRLQRSRVPCPGPGWTSHESERRVRRAAVAGHHDGGAAGAGPGSVAGRPLGERAVGRRRRHRQARGHRRVLGGLRHERGLVDPLRGDPEPVRQDPGVHGQGARRRRGAGQRPGGPRGRGGRGDRGDVRQPLGQGDPGAVRGRGLHGLRPRRHGRRDASTGLDAGGPAGLGGQRPHRRRGELQRRAELVPGRFGADARRIRRGALERRSAAGGLRDAVGPGGGLAELLPPVQ